MLVLLSGVSGAGKDTVKKELIKRNERITSLPSYTDRAPRAGEVNGEIYNFISTEEFEELIKMVIYMNLMLTMTIITELQENY